jgi:ankyrin repeat protein
MNWADIRFPAGVLLCALSQTFGAAAQRTADQQLVEAVMLGNESDVVKLIEQGANPRVKADVLDKQLPYPLLTLAMISKRPDIAVALLEGGADPNTTFVVPGEPGSEIDSTVLNMAIDLRQTVVFEALVEKGADVNGADTLGDTPLIEAVSKGHLEYLDLLLERGADPHRARTREKANALHYAVAFDRPEAVAKLLAAGADPRVRAGDGRSAIDIARQKGLDDIRRMLEQARQ